MRPKLKRWLLYGPLAAFLLLALAIFLVINTPVSERLAERFAARALRESGGTLTIASRRGTLAVGLDLEGVELRLPPRFTFTARRVHLRISRAALLVGMLQFKELVVEAPRVEVILPKESDAKQSRTSPPSWLRVSAPKVKVSEGFLTVRKKESEPLAWTDIEGQADLSWFMERLSVRVASLQVAVPKPFPSPLQVKGSVDFAGEGGRFDVDLASPRSLVHAQGSWKAPEMAPLSYHAKLGFAALALQEAAVGWDGAPDLTVSGTASVVGNPSSIAYDADLKAPGVGPVASKGTFASTGKDWSLSGDGRTAGATLGAFWRTPQGKEAVVAGKGTWSVQVKDGVLQGWKAEATLGASRIWGLPVNSGRVEGHGDRDRVALSGTFDSPLSGPAKGSVASELHGGTWSAEATGSQVPLPALLDALKIELPLPESMKPPPGTWPIGRFHAEGGAAGVRLEGRGADPTGARWSLTMGPITSRGVGSVGVIFSDVNPASWGLGPKGATAGEVTFSPEGTLKVAMDSAHWKGLTVQPFHAQLHFVDGAVRLDPLTLNTSVGRWSLQGERGRTGELKGAVEATISDLAKLEPFLGLGEIGGGLLLSVKVGGKPEGLKVEGHVSFTQVKMGEWIVGYADLSGRWSPSVEGSDLTLAWRDAAYGNELLGAGEAKVKGTPAAVQFGLECDAGATRRLALQARGRLGLRDGDLIVSGARIEALGKEFLQEGTAQVAWNPESVSWSGLALTKKESRLSASGRIGLAGSLASAPISGTLSAHRVPLGLLPMPKTAGSISGFLNADLSWSGSVDHPLLQGGAELSEGTYRVADGDYAISPVTAVFKAEGDRLTLVDARASTPHGGEARGSGFLRFRGFLPDQFQISMEGKDFPFLFGRDLDGTADFQATLEGTPLKPVLKGSAKVLKGRIQLPELERRKPLPETVRFINAPPGSPFAPVEQSPSLVGPLRGNIVLLSKGGLWVSSRNFLAEVSGEITIRFTERGPTLEGSLTVVQGRFLYQGRKFELEDSRIFFDGGQDLTPFLAVTARYTVQDTEVEVHLTGRASKPQVELTSRPPMDQADILSLLVFGRRASTLGTSDAQPYSSAAAGAVALYGAAPILEAAKGALGLDSMEVGVGPNPQVSFTKNLSERAVLEYQQTFGALPERWVNLRYRYSQSLSIQTGSSSKGTTGIDLFWERRY